MAEFVPAFDVEEFGDPDTSSLTPLTGLEAPGDDDDEDGEDGDDDGDEDDGGDDDGRGPDGEGPPGQRGKD